MAKFFENLTGTTYEMLMQAGRAQGLKDNFLVQLYKPRQTAIMSIPVSLIGGGEITLDSARVVYNPYRSFKKSQGGFNVSEYIFKPTPYDNDTPLQYGLLTDFAVLMTLKLHFLGIDDYVGGKTGMCITDAQMKAHPELLTRAMRKWGRDAGPEILSAGRGGVGPDVNTGPYMEEIMTGLLDQKNRLDEWQVRQMVTGKPVSRGGLQLRTESTGIGVANWVIAEVTNLQNTGGLNKLAENIKVVFQGAGNVAMAAMKYLFKKTNFKITAFSSKDLNRQPVTVICQEGFNADIIDSIIDAGFVDQSKAKAMGLTIADGDAIFLQDADVFVPAAGPKLITPRHLAMPMLQRVALVVEGANNAFDTNAVRELHNAPFWIIPGFIANSVGVGMSVKEREASRTMNMPSIDMQAQMIDDFGTKLVDFVRTAQVNFPCETGDVMTSVIHQAVNNFARIRSESIEASQNKV